MEYPPVNCFFGSFYITKENIDQNYLMKTNFIGR